jgi:hypothetical protein
MSFSRSTTATILRGNYECTTPESRELHKLRAQHDPEHNLCVLPLSNTTTYMHQGIRTM